MSKFVFFLDFVSCEFSGHFLFVFVQSFQVIKVKLGDKSCSFFLSANKSKLFQSALNISYVHRAGIWLMVVALMARVLMIVCRSVQQVPLVTVKASDARVFIAAVLFKDLF
jgi:hypothetical protein